MTAQQLKNSILQLAVQGKLVPQDPNDEPASVLLERISKERERLIKEKKIKKPKSSSRIFRRDGHYYEIVNGGEAVCIDEKIPFDIPESWEWSRLSSVLLIARGGSPRPIKDYLTNDENGVNWIKIGDTTKGSKYIFTTREKIKPEGIAKSRLVKPGDFLLSNSMSFGRPYILRTSGCIHDGWLVLSDVELCFNIDFLFYLLSSTTAKSQFAESAAGAVVQNLNIAKVENAILPIPPMEEQERIVAKIESILPDIQNYEEISSELDKLDNSLAGTLKKSILQHAIQGKLVPQDPSDESASVLLERIAKERAKMGKKVAKSMSRIERRDRGTYEIFPDGSEKEISGEVPFDIPESWEWCRMNNCLDVRDGTHDTPAYVTQGIPLITSKNLKNGIIDFSAAKMISLRDHQSISERSRVDSGDIMFAMIGSIGNPVLYKGDDVFSIKNMALFKKIENGLNMEYVLMWLTCQQSEMRKQAAGGVQSFVALNYLRNYLIPVPPLKEQHRIVDKLGVLMEEIGTTK